jgi:asparagine synthase (glutamine-hydrolysing)
MCGISGFFSKVELSNYENLISKMNDSLVHRGPDDSGLWFDEQQKIALGHKRLSILDLSIAGHQPMFSDSGRFVIVFNGEIYNHLEVRKKIEFKNSVLWKSNSDTETLLNAIELFGLDATLKICNGMFAFALWDRNNNELILVRDRIGEKPLYYGYIEGTLYFSSELKAIKNLLQDKLVINYSSISSFLSNGYIKSPNTIWKNILKLDPGSYLRFNKNTIENFQPIIYYWTLEETISNAKANPYKETLNDAILGLEKILTRSISDQMISDVSLGAFLSGGIDSTIVVALMQQISKNPINTFTIGFDELKLNEAVYAKNIAKYLNTNHTELYVSDTMARDIIPQINDIYDEPFGDSSAIPTILVSKLAKSKVTVSLSGDGGDELFAGYTKYGKANTLKMFSNYHSFFPIELFKKIFSNNSRMIKKIDFYSRMSKIHNKEDFYFEYINQWSDNPMLNIKSNNIDISKNEFLEKLDNQIELMMYLDMKNYLPDDILVKVDRAAMSVGLETRVPMLDKDVIEFAWSLPMHFKYKNGEKKYILKQLLNNHIPKELYNRPKMGFGAPVGEWLNGPLRDWAEDLLSKDNINKFGVLDFEKVNKRWLEHKSKKYNWKDSLWNILMLQSWLNSQNKN